jgi:hypothetical protein
VKVKRGQEAKVNLKAPGRVIVHPRKRATEDLTTGLMWQMADNGKDITHTGANALCEDLDQGGYSDWRLPSIHELLGLYDPQSAATKRFHSIDGISLTGCCPWTSTPRDDFYWTLIFYNGMRYLKYDIVGKYMRALCVREAVVQ